jgi:hypothetical protein
VLNQDIEEVAFIIHEAFGKKSGRRTSRYRTKTGL